MTASPVHGDPPYAELAVTTALLLSLLLAACSASFEQPNTMTEPAIMTRPAHLDVFIASPPPGVFPTTIRLAPFRGATVEGLRQRQGIVAARSGR